jgi:DNA-binding transcriptional ArsR family regulator
MYVETLPSSAQTASVKAKLFRGLADTSRLRVLEALRVGPRCVSEVVAATGLSQPNVSGHLACLWDCGLVEREQRGRFVYYRIADPRVEALLSAADDLLVTIGANVYVCTRYEVDQR